MFQAQIGLNRKLRISAFLAGTFLFVLIGLALFPLHTKTETTSATTKQSETVMTLSTEDLTLDFEVASVDGSFAGDTASVSVTTNNATGYTLSINTGNTGDNAGKLVGENNSFNPISGATTETDFTNSTSYNGLWGYKPSKVNGEANTSYLPAPTEITTIEETNAPNKEANIYEIGLGARADMSYEAGGYINSFIITSVANPVGYTINYSKNTEDEVTNMPESQTGAVSADYIILADDIPLRTSYQFLGWCDGDTTTDTYGVDTCDGDLYAAGSEFDIDHTSVSTTLLRATWDSGNRSITFYGNGADGGTMEQQSLVSGSSVTINKNQFTREGYAFVGWNTKADGSGTGYMDEGIYDGGDSITLYAQWVELHDVTVKYHLEENDNTVVYSCYYGDKNTTRYSHTPNVSDTGTKQSAYENDASLNEVITIPGAASLHITLTYQTEGIDWDWVSLWEGSHPEYTAADDYVSGFKIGCNKTGKYGGTSKKTVETDISGNTVTFGFTSDGGVNDYFGYYAVITSETGVVCLGSPKSGNYVAPVSPDAKHIAGWNIEENAATIQFADETAVKESLEITNLTNDIYYVYEEKIAVFDTGQSVNEKIKKLSGQSDSPNTRIKKIATAESLPNNFSPSNKNTLSTSNSKYPIYAWYDSTNSNNTIYVYSEAIIYLNEDSSEMLYGFDELANISALSDWKASRAKNLSDFFWLSKKITDLEPLKNWDVSSVTNLDYFLYYTSGEESIDVSHLAGWDVSNVTSMSYMFYHAKITNLKSLAGWDTSNVINMTQMFNGSKPDDISVIEDWNTSNVKYMGGTFASMSIDLNLIDDLDTQSVSSMYEMFQGATIINPTVILDWDTSKVTDMSKMFKGAKGIINLDAITYWDTSKVTDMSQMFSGSTISTTSALGTGGRNNKDYTSWDVSNVKNMSYMFRSTNLSDLSGVANWNTISLENAIGMFSKSSIPAHSDALSNLNTSNATDLSFMFYEATGLGNASALQNWNTSKVTNMKGMFGKNEFTNLNSLAGWDVGKVTNMAYMFRDNTSLADISAINNWNIASITDTTSMFQDDAAIGNLTVLNNWSSVGNIYHNDYIFSGIPCTITRPAWYTSDTSCVVITYNGNGADGGNMNAQELTYDANMKLAQNQYTYTNHSFVGWNTKRDGTGVFYEDESIYNTYSTTLYAQWVESNISATVNYEINGETNTVVYGCNNNGSVVTRYSHTPNVGDDGVKNSGYSNSIDMNDIVTIEGAESIHVVLKVHTEHSSMDYVAIWEGSHPDYSATANYSAGVKTDYNTIGKYFYKSVTKDDEKNSWNFEKPLYLEIDIPGDSVTFGFHSGYGGGFGYYATVTGYIPDASCQGEPLSGSYIQPIVDEDDTFWWGLGPDSTSGFANEEEVKASLNPETSTTMTLYAIWGRPTTINYHSNGGSGSMESVKIKYGETATNTNEYIAPEGMVFAYWNTEPDNSGTRYNEYKAVTIAGGTVNLYAQWKNTTPGVDGGSINEDGGNASGNVFPAGSLSRAYELAYYNANKPMYVRDVSATEVPGWRPMTYADEANMETEKRFAMQDISMIFEENSESKNVCEWAALSLADNSYIDSVKVIDIRDGNEYDIIKAPDGRCWTQDNLALDLTDSGVQSRMNSANTNASEASISALFNGGRISGDSTTNGYATTGVLEYNGIWSDNYGKPFVRTSYKNMFTNDALDEQYKWKVGVYYNYCAASAGSYCYGNGTSIGSPVDRPNTAVDSENDICPAGWRMPTGYTYDANKRPDGGEYNSLYESYNESDINIRLALHFPMSGGFTGSDPWNFGQNGISYLWSATYTGDRESMASALMYDDPDFISSGTSPRYYGLSIRCIAK